MPVLLEDFARYVRPDVTGCPDIIINDAIVRAGMEFCKRTKSIKESVVITTIAGTSTYAVQPTLGNVNDVLGVKRDGADYLTPLSHYDFELHSYNDAGGQPTAYYMDANNALVLGGIPDAVEDLTVEVSIIPANDAIELPDLLGTRYKMQIASGAKAILMLMSNKPWTSLQVASGHQSLFNAAIDEENIREAQGRNVRPLRTRSNFF